MLSALKCLKECQKSRMKKLFTLSIKSKARNIALSYRKVDVGESFETISSL